MEYIRENEYAEFTDEKGKVIYKLSTKAKDITFFLVNVTLEPLGYLSIATKSLETLGILKNGYPWSISIFDLDVITGIVTSPSFFVDYVQKRSDPRRMEPFVVAEELDLFQVYLTVGNFYSPAKDLGQAKIVLGSFTDNFDNHFLFGEKPPKLNIEPDWLKLIEEIEISRPPRYSRIISALLELDHENRRKIILNFKKIAEKSVKDRKMHSFLSMDPEGDTGFSFVTAYRDDELDYFLFNDSERLVSEYNRRIWIGIGKDVSKKEKIATSFYYSESSVAV